MISFLFTHPIQYNAPMVRHLLSYEELKGLKVYYCFNPGDSGVKDKEFGQQVKWDIPLLEGYPYVFLKNYSPTPSISSKMKGLWNWGIFRAMLKDKNPIWWVTGWNFPAAIIAILWGKLIGKKIWFRGDNTYSDEIKKSKKVLAIKRILMGKILFPCVDTFLYVGEENKRFFSYYGVKPAKLVHTPHAVNNAFFQEQAALYADKGAVRKELGLPVDKKIVLFCGKYISIKRPFDALDAIRQMKNKDILLLMVGDGELRPEMENYIKKYNLEENVILAGFVNQSKISQYYAASDALILISTSETWGLAVNEAMNFSLPFILTNTVGCGKDLVRDNGMIVPMGDSKALAEAITQVFADEARLSAMGKNSRTLINSFSYDVVADAVLQRLKDKKYRA